MNSEDLKWKVQIDSVEMRQHCYMQSGLRPGQNEMAGRAESDEADQEGPGPFAQSERRHRDFDLSFSQTQILTEWNQFSER